MASQSGQKLFRIFWDLCPKNCSIFCWKILHFCSEKERFALQSADPQVLAGDHRGSDPCMGSDRRPEHLHHTRTAAGTRTEVSVDQNSCPTQPAGQRPQRAHSLFLQVCEYGIFHLKILLFSLNPEIKSGFPGISRSEFRGKNGSVILKRK